MPYNTKSWFVPGSARYTCMRNRGKRENGCLILKMLQLKKSHKKKKKKKMGLLRMFPFGKEGVLKFSALTKEVRKWHGQIIIPQCRYVTLASTSLIKASMSTTKDQAAKSCVAMVTAVLATNLTRDRLLMSSLLGGSAAHSQALSATQLLVCGSSRCTVD